MRSSLPTLAAVVAVVALMLTTLLGTQLGSLGSVTELGGTWRGQQLTDEGTWVPVELTLPGTFLAQGLPGNTRVAVERDIELEGAGPWVLHLSKVRYGLEVALDGVPVRMLGSLDPHAIDAERHEGSALVVLPQVDPGTHRLRFDLRGALYRGGLTGQVRVAPLHDLTSALMREYGGHIGFALTFGLVGCVHLLSASLRSSRGNELLFGGFTLSLSAYAFQHAAGGILWSSHPYLHHVLRRVFVAGIMWFAVAFVVRFVYGRNGRVTWAWLAAHGSLLVLALTGEWGSATAEVLQDITVITVVVPWVLVALLHSARHGVPGSRWLVAAVVVAAVGGLQESLISHGLVMGPRLFFPALCLFLVLGSLALARQDRALSDRHRRLVTHSEDAMLEVSDEGVVRQLNPAAQAFLPGLDTGGRFLEVVPDAARPLVAAHLSRAGIAPTRCEFALVDGRVVESVATPVDAHARVLVLRDVSRRRRAEDDLLTAARVETAGLLVGGIAHDFNNLLAALLGHVGLLRMELDGEGPQGRLDRMEGVIERASGVTRRLLAVGGRSSATPDHVAVDALLAEVIEMAEPVLPSTITLRAVAGTNLSMVYASAEDLRHVVLNLVLNARDAIGGEGSIEVRAERNDHHVRIDIVDDGPGVPDGILERIWDPFFTTKGPDRGTGLGLPMARRLVRQAGGRITYLPGDGGTFRIELPVADGSGAPVVPSHHGGRVAVVDDEEDLRSAFAEALRRAGYDVVSYADATTALPALVTEPPDVLVTDVVMPGMSGLELVTALRELQPDLPVLVVSGFVPAREQLLRDGRSEHLDKPLRTQQVVDAVGRLMGHSLEGLTRPANP